MSQHAAFPAILVACFLFCASASATEPPITGLAFAPDGKSVIACSQVGIQVFSWPGLTRQRVIKTDTQNLHDIEFSPDGSSLAVGGGSPAEDGIVEVYSWPKFELIKTLKGHDDSVRSVFWLDRNKLLSGSVDRTIKLRSIDEKDQTEHLKIFTGHSRSVDSICVLDDGKTLVSGGVDQSIRVWDIESGKLIRSMSQHTQGIHSVVLRPGKTTLPMVASAAADRTIRFWQPTIGRMVRYIRLESEPLSIAWLNDNRWIAAACQDGKVRLVNADEVKLNQTILAFDGWAYSIAVHPNDGSLAVGGSNGSIRRRTLETLNK